MTRNIFYVVALTFLVVSCKKNAHKQEPATPGAAKQHLQKESLEAGWPTPLERLPDTAFVRLSDYSSDFVYDMKYATSDNFLKEVVYDCPECYTRVSTAKALIEVNKDFMEKGYRIKFFDCYRPHSIQKKMWAIFPNPTYVADPAKGSIHNKGGAIDITLVDASGKELDMGTPFDFFGKEARHAYAGHPDTVLANRELLKTTMEAHGFNAITSEWWHYNYGPTLEYGIADFTWECLK